MAEVAIQLKGLSHSYGERKALTLVDLTVGAGEIFGVVGPNGGGKSTLFRILSTLMFPSAGSVQIFSHDVLRDPSAVRSLTGVVFQSPALDKKLTVTENLYAQGYCYGQKGAALHEKVVAALSLMELADRGQELVEKLSGGMKRRLEIAKALLHEPKLLLLDEPTTGLDPAMRREVWDHLKRLRDKRGITVVATTHLMEEAEMCDRIALIDQGKIVCLGNPGELRDELGGNMVSIHSSDLESLKRKLESSLSLSPVIVAGEIRIAKGAGKELVSRVLDSFSNEIESITLGKPTLDDLFIQKTGRRLSEPGEARA